MKIIVSRLSAMHHGGCGIKDYSITSIESSESMMCFALNLNVFSDQHCTTIAPV
jgi:hypothetical protein